ncbi:hypothetical protein PNOK_0020800 [Pyrrhoderma noxium]|uniref:Uncharacterized protein n=1 Tax=Pyrrhoderma noxium TaxID=2282107 RepID=A0A286UU61_9AGAM|nr:hypothetical protein PNOK_0020800 [Pyrrhoderma noxium]
MRCYVEKTNATTSRTTPTSKVEGPSRLIPIVEIPRYSSISLHSVNAEPVERDTSIDSDLQSAQGLSKKNQISAPPRFDNFLTELHAFEQQLQEDSACLSKYSRRIYRMECSMNVLQKRLNSSIAELKSLGESLGNITTTRHQKIGGLVKSLAEARTALMGNLPNVQMDIQEQEETLALREIEVSRREKAIATKELGTQPRHRSSPDFATLRRQVEALTTQNRRLEEELSIVRLELGMNH